MGKSHKELFGTGGGSVFRCESSELVIGRLADASKVVLALQVLSTHLTIGDINLIRTVSTDLYYEFRRNQEDFDEAWQGFFAFAAYEGFVEWHKEQLAGSNLIDYEATRASVGGKGMKLEARNLSFTYPGTHRAVVRDVSFTVEAGETLAIVGYNGAAKTSLVKALMGLYDVDGELLINGVPIDKISHLTLHRRMSALFQDYGKYALTVHDNVATGDAGHGDLDIEAFEARDISVALERGGAEGVVEQQGLDAYLDPKAAPMVVAVDEEEEEKSRSVLGSMTRYQRERLSSADDGRRAVALSGGQWQRVALARAFMRAEEADLIVFECVTTRCGEYES